MFVPHHDVVYGIYRGLPSGFKVEWLEKVRGQPISHFVWSRGSPRRRAVLKSVVASMEFIRGMDDWKNIDINSNSQNESRVRRVSNYDNYLIEISSINSEI